MTRFRVHLDNGEIVPVDADTPDEASAQVRKTRKGAIVRKVKRDKSDKPSERFKVKMAMSGDYGKINLTKNKPQYITINGKQTDIERGSMQHAEIDSTHRMREDGSYFNHQ